MDDERFAGLAPRRDAIDADGVRISYAVWGDDSPDIVMLHGITSSAMTWWRVAPELARKGYRVIAPDMPGHGDSAGAGGSFALAKTARTIDAFMSVLAVRSPIVIGHSWGGGVTLLHAATPSSQVVPGGVVLVDPLIRMPHTGSAEYRETFLAQLGRPRSELQGELRAANPAWDHYDVYWKAEALEKCQPAAVVGVFGENRDVDLRRELRNLVMPWGLIVADPAHGGILSQAMWQELEAAAAGGRGRVFGLPGVGHDVHREDFAGFMAVLERYLAVGA